MRLVLCLCLALLLLTNPTAAKKKKKHSGAKKDGAVVTSELEQDIENGNYILATLDESGDVDSDEVFNYIVVLKNDAVEVGADAFATIEEKANAIVGSAGLASGLGHVYANTIKGFSVKASAAGIEVIRADSMVSYVAKEEIMYADQQRPTGVRRVLADKLTSWTPDPNVVAAILDTGVDQDHSELNVGLCRSFVNGVSSCEDDGGHGTHVAGTVAGKTTGVAPGAEVWGIKVLHGGGGSTLDISKGIDFVAGEAKNNPGKKIVINMSLGGTLAATQCDSECRCGTDAMHAAVCRAVKLGVTFVVSAGNDSKDSATKVPASYEEVITVSAVDDKDGSPGGDTLASFSNYGRAVDIAAPGVNIYSASLRGGYATLSGTSMAAPHVTGGAVIFMSGNSLDDVAGRPDKVKDALLAAADAQASDRGFTGDKDNFPEPMLNVKKLESSEPAPFKLSCEFEKGGEYAEGDTSAKLTVKAVDNNGKLVKLKNKNYGDIEVVNTSSGKVVNPSIKKPRAKKGVWKPVLQLTSLDMHVYYSVKVTATWQGHTASGLAKLRVGGAGQMDEIYVVSNKWSYHRANNIWFQRITLNRKVSAQIRIATSDPSKPTSKKWTGSGGTTIGSFLFGFTSPPIGTCHNTTVTSLISTGLVYAKDKNAVDYGTTLL